MYVHGRWPEFHIDHIDGDGKNNAIRNLRQVTHYENHQNLSLRATNKSGCTGVSWHSQVHKWTANIWLMGKRHYLGCFDTIESARDAYCAAKKDMHKVNPVLRDA
jgi:hypothetical protein